jgi:hypothetical protein
VNVKEVTMVTAPPADVSTAALAQLLFAGPLQPSQRPSPAMIRAAVDAQHNRCDGNLNVAAALVAQEAGDHPDCYAERMHWAIGCVALAYPDARRGRPRRAAPGRAA